MLTSTRSRLTKAQKAAITWRARQLLSDHAHVRPGRSAVSRACVELRSATALKGGGTRVAGHAAVFGRMADLGHNGYEVLARTAFDKTLRAGADVRALVNHDPSQLLARTGNGSLRLKPDNAGLGFELDLPDTSLGRDVRAMVASDLLNQMSFGFIPGEFTWGEAPDGRQVRTHTSIAELRDVSLVTYPAYDGTIAELRDVAFPARAVPRRLARAKARLLLEEAVSL